MRLAINELLTNVNTIQLPQGIPWYIKLDMKLAMAMSLLEL